MNTAHGLSNHLCFGAETSTLALTFTHVARACGPIKIIKQSKKLVWRNVDKLHVVRVWHVKKAIRTCVYRWFLVALVLVGAFNNGRASSSVNAGEKGGVEERVGWFRVFSSGGGTRRFGD